jgi:hypothetical protein
VKPCCNNEERVKMAEEIKAWFLDEDRSVPLGPAWRTGAEETEIKKG